MSENTKPLAKALIFAGTSISHEDAAKVLDATYWPPISRGDIEKAILQGYATIGIIDGIFFSRAAVAHKEIIRAIKEGITVVGGCSMGALRASELDVHGMTGVGQIYEWYRDGVIEDDDEVAVATNPDTFEPVSNPMVNIRETFKAALKLDIIKDDEFRRITELAKRTHYTERSYFGITKGASREGIIPEDKANELLKFCIENERNIKREDALLVLEKIKQILTE
ncbi:TfuA-related McrA-glycine thioamidation protein [Methanolobus mangrovi]|uniref:TfuA-related McrA-glycine thioamidation protein n=1 Tax=Methanolobus mangrovi TaxID=3072977 RepID=A0AA51UF66_9EURY|nr:TfuA-related McrA-glycine thioamidation protein [Methanolobus mangrovi]WMW22109.1 TfuA-related McrA-glycine thioamidation protein [Methanolobus mangrovi]